MHRDKRALVDTLRKYKRHILGPLFCEAADTIEELLYEMDAQKIVETCDGDSCPIDIKSAVDISAENGNNNMTNG
jgi:hypothetical protein